MYLVINFVEFSKNMHHTKRIDWLKKIAENRNKWWYFARLHAKLGNNVHRDDVCYVCPLSLYICKLSIEKPLSIYFYVD